MKKEKKYWYPLTIMAMNKVAEILGFENPLKENKKTNRIKGQKRIKNMKKEIKEKIIEDVEKGIEWDLKTGKYKNLREILQDCKKAYKLLGGGGYYGLNFEDLIDYLETKLKKLGQK